MACRDDSCNPIKRAPRAGEVVNRCCGAKDLGPISDDEGPSEDDLAAFDGVTRVCPECKVEVYDEATICHNCGHAFSSASKGLPTWAVATLACLVGAITLGLLVFR